jgi:branched-chain amino acid transport system substrate-binding protein
MVALATVAGCSSGSTPAASGTAAAAGTGSADPIVVGGLGDLTVGTGEAQGFEAGIAGFNRAGGLDGRQIKFVGWDDEGFSAQTTLADAQQLVLSHHVMAIVPVESAVATGAVAAFLAQSKVPFIGWATDAAFAAGPAWGLGINGNQTSTSVQGIVGMDQLLAASHNTGHPKAAKMALIGENVASAAAAVHDFAGLAGDAGMDVVYQGTPIPLSGEIDYAPFAANLISSGANIVYEITDGPNAIGLAAALKDQGFKGMIVNGSTYYPGQLASQQAEAAELNGIYVENEFPSDENDTPAVRQAISDLKSIGQPPYLTQGVSVGYWSALVFEQMLQATLKAVGGDPAKVTGATLERTVNSGFTYTDTLAGGIGSEHFPAAESTPTGCGTLVQAVGDQYRQVEPYQCLGAVNVTTGKAVSQLTGQSQ